MNPVIRLLPYLIISAASAQNFPFQKLREKELPVTPVYHSVDRLGGVLIFGDEKMIRLSPEGVIEAERNNSAEFRLNEVRLTEAWNPLRIWMHLKTQDGNKIHYLDSKLFNAEEPLTIDPSFSVAPLLIAPGSNNYTCWILDIDHSLKMIRMDKSAVEWESEPVASPDGEEFIHLRFWQNFFLLTTEKGTILVANRLGKVLKTFQTTAQQPGVLGEDIYYLSGDRMIFENLYTAARNEIRLPYRPDRVVATDERLLLFRGKKIDVYLFQPPK